MKPSQAVQQLARVFWQGVFCGGHTQSHEAFTGSSTIGQGFSAGCLLWRTHATTQSLHRHFNNWPGCTGQEQLGAAPHDGIAAELAGDADARRGRARVPRSGPPAAAGAHGMRQPCAQCALHLHLRRGRQHLGIGDAGPEQRPRLRRCHLRHLATAQPASQDATRGSLHPAPLSLLASGHSASSVRDMLCEGPCILRRCHFRHLAIVQGA